MGLIGLLLRASRGVVALSVVAGLTRGVCGVGLIALIHTALERHDPARSTRGLALAFLLLCVAAALARIVAQATMVRLAQGTVCRLGLSLCQRLLAVPLRSFEGLDSSAMLAVLTEDIMIVANGLAGIPLLAIDLPLVAVCMAYVGWLSPLALGAGVVFAALAIAIYRAVARRAFGCLAAARSGQDVLVGHFRALIGGFRELRQHRGRREAFFTGLLQPAAETVRDRSIAGMTGLAVAGTWGQIAFFGFLGTLIFGLRLERDVLAGVVLAVVYIMLPLETILTGLALLGRAQVSLRRIEALGRALEREAADTATAAAARPFAAEIVLDGVSHAYDDEEFLLGPIDLTLRSGEILFLTGGNGSGKTTLVKLLAGLYPPGTGTIRLDGRPVTDESREEYRQLFAVVFADGHVFPTLLGLDRPGLDGAAGAMLRRLGLDGRVGVEGGAFSTLDVSLGQRKRLALLTAWLEDRPIVILDEAAANQDASFKRFFYHELLPDWRRRGKTLVVITHDDAYDDVADRVLRLDGGRLCSAVEPIASAEGPR